MKNIKKQVIFEALKYSIISAPLLFLGFFLDAGVNGYSANITGEFFNSVIKNQYSNAQALLGTMIFTLVTCVIVLPLIVLGTNILFFFFSLKHDFRVINSFFSKSYEDMIGFSSGTIVQKLFRDPNQLLTLLVVVPAKLFAQIIAFAFMTYLMIRISPTLCIVCVCFGILAAVFPLFFRKKLAQLDESQKEFKDQTSNFELEMISTRNFLKNYNLENFFAQKQGDAYDTFYQKHLTPGVFTEIKAMVLPEFFLLVGQVSFLLIGMYQTATGQLEAGKLIAFFTYLTLTTSLITQIYNQSRQLAQLPDSISRIATLLTNIEKGTHHPIGTWNVMQVSDLTYQYSENSSVLRYCDFNIKKNTLIEIKGLNGTGKTTLILLLCGLLHPKTGSIALDSNPIEQFDLTRWRDKISCVEQIPALFPGTVRENIHIGDLSATTEQVDQILKQLRLYEYADYEVNTSQQLSGGELKKIALGRSLLRNADIVFFDEPFENLDEAGLQVVKRMLLDKTKTRIFVHHGTLPEISADYIIQL